MELPHSVAEGKTATLSKGPTMCRANRKCSVSAWCPYSYWHFMVFTYFLYLHTEMYYLAQYRKVGVLSNIHRKWNYKN